MKPDLQVLAFPEKARRNPDKVLENCKGVFPKIALVLGVGEDGDIAAHGTIDNKHELVYLLEQFKHDLLSGRYG